MNGVDPDQIRIRTNEHHPWHVKSNQSFFAEHVIACVMCAIVVTIILIVISLEHPGLGILLVMAAVPFGVRAVVAWQRAKHPDWALSPDAKRRVWMALGSLWAVCCVGMIVLLGAAIMFLYRCFDAVFGGSI